MSTSRKMSQLVAFVHVAETGSFTKAAKAIGVTKSAVSQQVTLLESTLGIRLLNRTTRGVSVTAAGEKVARRARNMADQAETIFREVEDEQSTPSGRFALTYPHALEADVVLPALMQLSKEYPALTFELHADDSDLDLVKNKLDVAVRVGELADSSYRALAIGQVREWFCATPDYIAQHGMPSHPTELLNQPWIVTPWQKRHFTLRHELNDETYRLKPRPQMSCKTFSSILPWVQQSLGFALLPDINVRNLLRDKALVRMLPDWQGPNWPVYLVHAYQTDRPIHIQRFHQLLQRAFNALEH